MAVLPLVVGETPPSAAKPKELCGAGGPVKNLETIGLNYKTCAAISTKTT